MMRRVVGASVAALVCLSLLSACALLSGGSGGDVMSQSDVQMQHVTDAVKHHDAAALEELFSPHARAAAPELKSGIKYFLLT